MKMDSNTKMTQTKTSRKRCRGVVGLGLSLAAMWCTASPAAAFTNPSLAGFTSSTSTRVNTNALYMATKSSTDLLAAGPARLSTEAQRQLLLQAVELRRLKNLETELAMPTKTAPLLSVRSREAGYGEDLMAYENALLEGEKARESLITTNIGLVHFCVNEIIGTKKNSKNSFLNSLSREDLIQEGAIGLARAIDRWNPAIGGKFSTYAVYWIRACVLRCIAEKDDLLRVPEHVSTTVRKMTKAAQKMGLELDSENILSNVSPADSNWKEAKAAKALAVEAGLTDKQLTEAMRIRNRRKAGGYVAFESWMQNGADIESDVSTVATREEPLRSVETESLKKALGKYLRPKEMEALFWRYGLLEESAQASAMKESKEAKKQPKNYLAQAEEELFGTPKKAAKKTHSPPVKGKWGEAMSFKEVGKNMEVSAEYGRRLCHGALKKLRQAAEEGHLEPALLF